MKATEQYIPVVLFIMLYKVVLTFESVDEILKCEHSNGRENAIKVVGRNSKKIQTKVGGGWHYSYMYKIYNKYSI